ncbi:MAG: hypothetical protein KIT31_11520 [Deltaproteobacteria bacterium]|nr:hypothetical protein [Deltaproteobacteria bacterium]
MNAGVLAVPSWLAGALTGLAAGAVAAFVLGLLTVTAKRARNARLMARGEPPIKDAVFAPLYGLHAPVGAIAGGIAAGIRDEGVATGILAGVALPALLAAVILAVVVAQAFRA